MLLSILGSVVLPILSRTSPSMISSTATAGGGGEVDGGDEKRCKGMRVGDNVCLYKEVWSVTTNN